MTDYFSKWIEADSFRQVTDKEVISFIRTNIICRYKVPSEIVCDNGTQFVGKRTKAFCDEWNIILVTLTPGYPKGNGQVESSNKVVIICLKKKLKSRRVIPAEVHVPTSRYSLNNIEANNSLMHDSLVLIEELRDAAKIRIASYQQTVGISYNKNVKIRVFREGDLVVRKHTSTTAGRSTVVDKKVKDPDDTSKCPPESPNTKPSSQAGDISPPIKLDPTHFMTGRKTAHD
ncbi:uncharacterized protein LOC141588504 [Silene latifolia]|uniref:uncharacterized protein LOC141588504 n=1 Tax=Silene latifolia TaxID=37657 RepID=UPI003D77859D